MDWLQIGAICASAFLGTGFLQFWITRGDKHRQESIDTKLDAVRNELKDHLTAVNSKWKTDYCDKNAEGISELSEISKDLKDNVVLLTTTVGELKKYNETIGKGIEGLSKDKLLFLCSKYQKRGAVTLSERAVLEDIYKPYHELGGNGLGTQAFEYVLGLKVVSDEEAAMMDAENSK